MTWTVKRLRAVLAAAGALLLSPVIGMVGSVAAELWKVHSGHLCLARQQGLADLVAESTRRYFAPVVGAVREIRKRWNRLLTLL